MVGTVSAPNHPYAADPGRGAAPELGCHSVG
jgi:hypothetical protein